MVDYAKRMDFFRICDILVMKVKDASGAVSAPAAADLYYFPSAVYDGSLCLEARSLDDDPELFSVWELSWESPDEDNGIVSADLYLSRDGGSFRLERTVTDGSLVMGFDDAQEILMCRIAAEYEDGTYGLSDILALEKTEKEARIEACGPAGGFDLWFAADAIAPEKNRRSQATPPLPAAKPCAMMLM